MTVLITGGAGYIGSNIARLLIKKKIKVCIVDDLSENNKLLVPKKAIFYKNNILNTQKLRNIIVNNKISSIFHLAAKIKVPESEIKPEKYFLNNFIGTIKLLEATKNTNVRKFIFSSTCAVYGNQRVVSEKSKISPTSVYGESKYFAEKYIESFSKKNDLNYVILRYFNVCGSDPNLNHGQVKKNGQLFKNLALESIKKQPKIKIFGDDFNTNDGTCERDYIHVSDISRIHFLSLKFLNSNNKNLLLNCGYGNSYSVKKIVSIFQKISEKKFNIKIEKRRKGDVKSIKTKNSMLKKVLKFKPKYNNIYKIVKSCIDWEKNSNNDK